MLIRTSAFHIPALLVLGGCFCASAATAPKTINRDWTFQYFPAEEAVTEPAAPAYDDSKWPAVALPHTWSTYETTRDLHPFIKSPSERDDSYWWYGWGWYRKRISLDKRFASSLVFLEFDGVQKYSRVYVNGELVGQHQGGYTSFCVDITPKVKFGQENVIAVQVSNRRDDDFGKIPPMTAGNFDLYGGIYRDVRLVIKDRLHMPYQGSADSEGGTFILTPEVTANRGVVQAKTWVRNSYPAARKCALRTIVRDADGKAVLESEVKAEIRAGELFGFDQNLGAVEKPNLWSPESPYLYTVTSELVMDSKVVDSIRNPLGFRWFSWNKEERRLYLNGKQTVLRGINRHQEYPWLGDAMPKWMHQRDLEDIRRNMGLYFQRTVHYPNDPYVYDLCDRMGFILIEELPNIKDIAFGRDVQKRNLIEMIRRDRNHPSIFIWSMGNETNHAPDSAWAKAEDTSRLIYMRRAENGGDYIQMTDKDLSIENLLRCTVRGWYNSDVRDFGPETRNAQSGQVTGTEEWQHQSCVDSGRLSNDNVVVWLYADHGADRDYLNSPLKHINPKGWTDMYRFPKYVYYLWQANYTEKPMAFIHPHFWRSQYVGQKKNIVVDSNCDEVELKVNGVSVGKRKPTDENSHSVVFEGIEVKRGTLTVEGAKSGSRVQSSVVMAGAPARIVLSASPEPVPADRSGIAVVKADIIDAKGVHVYGATNTLAWKVEGPGALVGPAVYKTDTGRTESMEGTMYIDAPVANVVRSTNTAGVIKVTVSSPGLESGTVTITAKKPADDSIAGIVEPPLRDEGRLAVVRDPKAKVMVLPAKSGRMKEIRKDYDFVATPGNGYREQLAALIRSENPTLDTSNSEAFRTLVGKLVALLEQRNGHLVADDYNFLVREFNNAKSKKKK